MPMTEHHTKVFTSITAAAPSLSRVRGTLPLISPPQPLLQFIQVLQPREHDLLAGLLNLPGEEDLVQDGVDLVEVEDQVQLAHVAEEGVEDLDEEVDALEVGQLVVVGVDARAEEEAGVPPVHDLVVPELDEVGLVFLVAGRYETVHLPGGGRRVSAFFRPAGVEKRESKGKEGGGDIPRP